MNPLPCRGWSAAFLLAGFLLITNACQARLASPSQVLSEAPSVDADTAQAVASAPVLTSTPPPLPLDRQALANLAYEGIYDQAVKLTDGEYVGQPFVEGGASRPTVTLQGITPGDLNQDGLADAVVLLDENSGGSGIFMYLAAVLNENGNLVNTSTILLGDRVRVKTVRVADGKIAVTLLTHASEDPLCCPTKIVEKTYQLDDSQIIPLEYK